MPRPTAIRNLAFFLAVVLSGGQQLGAQQPTVLAPPSASTGSSAVRELHDLPYVTGGVERQRLDLYLPPTAGGPARPLVAWIHGGGFEYGSKQDCPAKGLVAHGYVVASLGYRLSSQAIYPAQIEDAKAAIRWLRAHAGEYNIDPQHIGVSGESAGGELVALLGTTGDTRRFDVGENLAQSSAVQCVLDRCGPSDYLHWGDHPPPDDREPPNNSAAKLIGGPVHLNKDAARACSPLYFVNKDSAPFLIMHCDKDPVVPSQQSRVLDAALRNAGVETRLVIVPSAGHIDPGFVSPENLALTLAFFDRHLHPKL